MSTSARDPVIGAAACAVLVYFFTRIELVDEVRTGMRHIREAGRAGSRHRQAFAVVHHRRHPRHRGGRPGEVACRLAGFVAQAKESAPDEITFATRLGSIAGSVRVNVGELEHVMDNLLSNAVEAMQGRGTVTVTVALDGCTLDAEAALAQGLTVGGYVRTAATSLPDLVVTDLHLPGLPVGRFIAQLGEAPIPLMPKTLYHINN